MKYIPKYMWYSYGSIDYILYIPELNTYTHLTYAREWFPADENTEEGDLPYYQLYLEHIVGCIGSCNIDEVCSYIKGDHDRITELNYIGKSVNEFSQKDAVKEINLELRNSKVQKILNRNA